jgi:hypothetical protein
MPIGERVAAVDQIDQPGAIDVGVNLGRGDVGMSQ